MTERVEQWICIKFCSLNIPTQKLCGWFRSPCYGQLMIGSFITTTHLLMHHISCSFLGEHQITQVTQIPYSPDLVPCDFWFFSKLKSPFKEKRIKTIEEIQENTMGQLMATGWTVWGPKVPTLKGTEASLSYEQCFLYLLPKMSLFFILHGCIPSWPTCR